MYAILRTFKLPTVPFHSFSQLFNDAIARLQELVLPKQRTAEQRAQERDDSALLSHLQRQQDFAYKRNIMR